jgi:hypothetical protein
LLKLLLGSCTSRVSDNTNHVASPEVNMLLLEGHASLGRLLGLAHNLDMLANMTGVGRGPDIVEDKLAARGTDAVDATGQSQRLALVRLARLEVAELLEELGVVIVGLELVGVRVQRLVAAVEETLDLSGSDLVVLVGVELLLLLRAWRLGLGRRLGGSRGSLLRLLLLVLALLLTLLELCLGDLSGGLHIESVPFTHEEYTNPRRQHGGVEGLTRSPVTSSRWRFASSSVGGAALEGSAILRQTQWQQTCIFGGCPRREKRRPGSNL